MASLSVDKHCEMLMNQIRDRVAGTTEGFKLFVQMFTAVVGGAVVLHLQYPDKAASFAGSADALAILISVMGTVIILENIRSWKGLREKLSIVVGNDESETKEFPDPVWRAMMESVHHDRRYGNRTDRVSLL